MIAGQEGERVRGEAESDSRVRGKVQISSGDRRRHECPLTEIDELRSVGPSFVVLPDCRALVLPFHGHTIYHILCAFQELLHQHALILLSEDLDMNG